MFVANTSTPRGSRLYLRYDYTKLIILSRNSTLYTMFIASVSDYSHCNTSHIYLNTKLVWMSHDLIYQNEENVLTSDKHPLNLCWILGTKLKRLRKFTLQLIPRLGFFISNAELFSSWYLKGLFSLIVLYCGSYEVKDNQERFVRLNI